MFNKKKNDMNDYEMILNHDFRFGSFQIVKRFFK